MKTRTKIIIAILLGALVSWLFGKPASQERQGVLTNVNLQAYHESYNELYFAGQLPKNVSVEWGNLEYLNDMGLTTQRRDGSFSIVIDRATNQTDKQALMTLLHEECHVELDYLERADGLDVHGPAFQSCMLRLASKGAMKDLW
jgi:hypothetical protein